MAGKPAQGRAVGRGSAAASRAAPRIVAVRRRRMLRELVTAMGGGQLDPAALVRPRDGLQRGGRAFFQQAAFTAC